MNGAEVADYDQNKVDAAHQVLIELVHVLGDYADEMAVVGGWVPPLLIPESSEPHIGSIDVDLAFDLASVDDTAYATIAKILLAHGYRANDPEKKNAQFKYFKAVEVRGQEIEVEVDLLVGEYGGERGMNRRHESVQDVKALRARGADMLFPDHTETIKLTGELPNKGGTDTVKCRVAGVVAFLVMKGIVLGRRKKAKDAYDIEYVLRNYKGGTIAVAKLVAIHLSNGLVKEALEIIADKFESVDHVGPVSIADFHMIEDEEERARIQRRAFETVDLFLARTIRAD